LIVAPDAVISADIGIPRKGAAVTQRHRAI